MKAVSVSPVAHRSDGKRVVEAVIVADTTPATLPVTGEHVEGLSANDVFAPMSILYVVANVDNKIYIANESGQFVVQ